MKMSPSSRRLLPWIGAILLSVTVALGIIEVTRLSLEHDKVLGVEWKNSNNCSRKMDSFVSRMCSLPNVFDVKSESQREGQTLVVTFTFFTACLRTLTGIGHYGKLSRTYGTSYLQRLYKGLEKANYHLSYGVVDYEDY